LLSVFAGHNKLAKQGIEKLMVSLTRNDYEPDVCFWKSERATQFTSEQKLFPAPDFIAEVCPVHPKAGSRHQISALRRARREMNTGSLTATDRP
jgi:hypothetical protein